MVSSCHRGALRSPFHTPSAPFRSDFDPMSTGNVDEVRQRIIQLAREIEQMSQKKMSSEDYFSQFLQRVVGAIGGRAGAVWLQSGANQIQLLADFQLESTGFHDNPDALRLNQRLLQDVLQNGQACTHSPDDGEIELPTDDLVILGALQRQQECVGVVEIFQRKDTPAQARPGFLQFVEQMCGHACRHLDRQTEAEESGVERSKFSETFEHFVLELHRSLNPTEVASTCANDARLLVGCDRLSVAVQVGPRTDIMAISGQSAVNQKANLVRSMRKLAGQVLATGEPLAYTGKLEELPPQIEQPLAEYIQESGSRMVQIVPLFEPDPLFDLAEDARGPREVERPRRVVGGLVVEQVAESRVKEGLPERLELVKDHVATALTNSMRHERFFGMKLWRFLGRSLSWLEGRNRIKAGLVVVALVIAGLVLALVPWDYRVEATGQLMPVAQLDIFAPNDGNVISVLVKEGDPVQKGVTPLVILENLELNAQIETAISEQENNRELLSTLRAQNDRAVESGNDQDAIELTGRIREAEIQKKGLKKRLEILQKQKAELTVTATKDGVVATFQVAQKLINRPVNRGEKLLEVMEVGGESKWRLELKVEEHRVGHILRHQEERSRLNVANPSAVPVEFVLATASEKTYTGQLSRISTRADASAAGGSVVELHVEPTGEVFPEHRIGAQVNARVHCGQRSLFYVLFGDVVEFVRKRFWL